MSHRRSTGPGSMDIGHESLCYILYNVAQGARDTGFYTGFDSEKMGSVTLPLLLVDEDQSSKLMRTFR